MTPFGHYGKKLCETEPALQSVHLTFNDDDQSRMISPEGEGAVRRGGRGEREGGRERERERERQKRDSRRPPSQAAAAAGERASEGR